MNVNDKKEQWQNGHYKNKKPKIQCLGDFGKKLHSMKCTKKSGTPMCILKHATHKQSCII